MPEPHDHYVKAEYLLRQVEKAVEAIDAAIEKNPMASSELVNQYRENFKLSIATAQVHATLALVKQ